MSDGENVESVDFSLAELAGVDMSEIQEVSFEGLPAGLFMFRGVEGKLEKVDNAKEEKRGKITIVSEVIEVKSITERGISADDYGDYIGKKHTERFWIVPEKPEEGLGMFVRFARSIGVDTTGKPLGGCIDEDSGEPIIGIIDEIADGWEFAGKTRKKPRKGDTSVKDTVLEPIDVRKPAKKGAAG